MRIFFNDNTVAARFVADMLTDSRLDSALITIMLQTKLGDCYVSIVTDTSLEDIVAIKALSYLEQPMNTSPETTQAG